MKTAEELQKELNDLKEQFDSLKKDMDSKDEKINSLVEHNKQLFKETKTAKEKAKEYEQQIQAKEDQKNKEEGNVQAQLESALKKIKELEDENNNTLSKWSEEKLSNAALDIAVKAGAEKFNAENLARFVRDRLGFENGEIKVLDEDGNYTINKQEDLVKEFANNERFSAFITATKASGGGATSQKNGVQATIDENLKPLDRIVASRKVNND